MPQYHVLVTDYAWPALEIERRILAEVGAELIIAETGEAAELIALAPQADAILTCWQQVPPQALAVAEKCLIVSRYGIGLDNIPVAQATELGMLVTNVPDFCLEEVSDHTMALLLACARRVGQFARATHKGTWNLSAGRPMPRLRGQTLGLIGYGNIAQVLVPKALGFGLKIIAYTPRLPNDALQPFGTATNDLDFLLQQADYVSIHTPLTAETQQLIDARALRQMKSSAYLINTSRGAIIDETALHQALSEGWIAGAALDVLSQEPPPADHPLLALENVIATPHAAFYSETAIDELETKAARNVAQVLRGEVPASVVNPAVMDQANYRLGRG
jgi:D-3-phosphoglycerate dehydrogenase